MQSVCEEIAAENEGHAPGMTAVIGLSPEQVNEIASSVKDAYAANLNSSVQTVVSGTFDALTEVEAKAKEAGARRALRLLAKVLLLVVVPFLHTWALLVHHSALW